MFGITCLELMFRLRRNQVCTSRNWKLSQREVLSKDLGLFLKISLFLILFFFVSHIFAIAKQLPGFSIRRLPSREDFSNVYIYIYIYVHNIYIYIFILNVNIYMSINDYLFKYMSYVTKNFAFIVSPVLRCQILIQLISQYQTVIRILILK